MIYFLDPISEGEKRDQETWLCRTNLDENLKPRCRPAPLGSGKKKPCLNGLLFGFTCIQKKNINRWTFMMFFCISVGSNLFLVHETSGTVILCLTNYVMSQRSPKRYVTTTNMTWTICLIHLDQQLYILWTNIKKI